MKMHFNLDNIFSIHNNLSKPDALLAYINRLFGKKPQSLGEGLARIKKAFGVVERREPFTPNSREYIANDGSFVGFMNSESSLSISKHIVTPVKSSVYNENFSKKLAKLSKDYINIKFGDEVHIDRSIDAELFKPIKSDKMIVSFTMGRPNVDEVGYKHLKRIHYHNTNNIPYSKACAMGLKV